MKRRLMPSFAPDSATVRFNAATERCCGGGSISCVRGANIPPPAKVTPSALDRALQAYTDYLVRSAACARRTVCQYTHCVRGFLTERFGRGTLRLSRLRQADTNQHFQRKSATLCPSTLHSLAAALRAYFTFLRFRARPPNRFSLGGAHGGVLALVDGAQVSPTRRSAAAIGQLRSDTVKGQTQLHHLAVAGSAGPAGGGGGGPALGGSPLGCRRDAGARERTVATTACRFPRTWARRWPGIFAWPPRLLDAPCVCATQRATPRVCLSLGYFHHCPAGDRSRRTPSSL